MGGPWTRRGAPTGSANHRVRDLRPRSATSHPLSGLSRPQLAKTRSRRCSMSVQHMSRPRDSARERNSSARPQTRRVLRLFRRESVHTPRLKQRRNHRHLLLRHRARRHPPPAHPLRERRIRRRSNQRSSWHRHLQPTTSRPRLRHSGRQSDKALCLLGLESESYRRTHLAPVRSLNP